MSNNNDKKSQDEKNEEIPEKDEEIQKNVESENEEEKETKPVLKSAPSTYTLVEATQEDDSSSDADETRLSDLSGRARTRSVKFKIEDNAAVSSDDQGEVVPSSPIRSIGSATSLDRRQQAEELQEYLNNVMELSSDRGNVEPQRSTEQETLSGRESSDNLEERRSQERMKTETNIEGGPDGSRQENIPLEMGTIKSAESQRKIKKTASTEKMGTGVEGLPLPNLIPTKSIDFLVQPESQHTTDEDRVKPMPSDSSTEIYQFLRNFGRSSTGRSSLVTEAFIYMIIPPDGGYGWIILVLSFFCQTIADGLLFSLGGVLPDLARDLALTTSQAAVIASTQLGLYFFTGPIASAFINKFGFRIVGFTGALIACTSVLIGSFITEFIVLVIIYGAIAGIGFGMIWVSSQLIIGYYFEKYRPIASGISCSGSGLGVLMFSALDSAFIPKIGWRNTIRIHGVFVMAVCVMTLFYHAVKPTKVGRVVEFLEDEDESVESVESVEIASAFYSKFLPSTTDVRSHKVEVESHIDHPRMVTYSSKENYLTRACNKYCSCCPWVSQKPRFSSAFPTKRYVIEHGPLDRADVFYQGQADYSRNVEVNDRDDIQLIPGKESRARSIQYTLSVMRTSRAAPPKKPFISPKIVNAINVLFDLKILRNMEFQLLLLSAFMFLLGLNVPFVYAATRARSHIAIKYAEMMPAAIGITNCIFRISAGLLSFKLKFDIEYLCGGGMFLGGALTFFSAMLAKETAWFQFAFVICFAIGAAFYSALRALIYVKVLGLDNLTNAFGITAMCMGIGVFIGTSIAGILAEVTKSYDAGFFFAGTCMMLGGSIKIALPSIRKFRNRHEVNRNAKMNLIPKGV